MNSHRGHFRSRLPQPATAAPTTGAAGTSAPADAGQTGAAGTVTASGDSLLGASAASSLREHDGQEASGSAVRVQSVPADEGFWVGANETDRVWVQLTGTRGESDYKVEEGDDVDFTGKVTAAADGFAATAGVTDAEGAKQLTEQGYYIAVPVSAVKLSK